MTLRTLVRALEGLLLGLVALALASCWAAGGPSSYTPSPARGPTVELWGTVPPPPAGSEPEATASGEGSAAAALAPGPLELRVLDAVLLAFQNNRELAVERLNPPIRQTFEVQELAVFDPVLAASLAWQREVFQQFPAAGADLRSVTTRSAAGTIGLSEFLPTGTSVGVDVSGNESSSSSSDTTLGQTRVGLSVTQSLLQGAGVDVNLASVRQARLTTLASEYELRGFAEALMADVEDAYWDYALALRQIDIVTDSLALAERQQADTQERIAVGQLAEIELAAAQSEVALRTEGLINTRSALATAKLILLRLINAGPAGSGGSRWDRDITLLEEPIVPEAALDSVQAEVALALKMRPDLNQARLDLERNELELVKTRNGLLPRMDLFIALGKSGYAASFGDSVGRLGGPGYDVLAGVNFEYPPLNRGARARNEQALLTRQQAAEAVANLAQLVELDVRSAYIEVNRAREQVTATAATRKSQEETLRAETEKFQVGKSTTFLVARAQRDLLVGQIAEVQAVINYRKALVDLHRQEGSLLARQGIEAPGGAPPVLPRTRK
jgi:outer membrane protein TolC